MTKMAIWWPKLSFPPINLWNMPKLNNPSFVYQPIPFEQMITETDIKDMQALDVKQPEATNVSVASTLAQRGVRYGKFLDHAVIAQGLKDVMWATTAWEWMLPDQQQALEVIMDKVARILNGDPNYDDNWVDIAGYATLVFNRLREEQANANTRPSV